MTRVKEIEMTVDSLPEKEYCQFRHWFLENDWEKWDKQIKYDSKAGKLDFLVKEAVEAKKKNDLKDL